MYIPNN